MAVHLLLATVPKRRAAVELVLSALPKQTRHVDQIELVLDGYGDAPRPRVPDGFTVREWRTPKPSGPGGRWRVATELAPGTALVALDDDVAIASEPKLIEKLAEAAESGYAAAASGVTVLGGPATWSAQPSPHYLRCAIASAVSMPVGGLAGLADLRDRVKRERDLDILGDLGDDEALVSACLWLNDVSIVHVAAPNLRVIGGTQEDCQMVKRRARDGAKTWDRQRVILREVLGWPWVCPRQ